MPVTFPAWLRPGRVVMTVVVSAFAVLSTMTVLLRSLHGDVRDHRVASHVARGDVLVAEGEMAAAADQYRAALQLERDHTEAGRALAVTLLALGKIDESESHLLELLRADPTNGTLNRGLARVHDQRGRDADARKAYQRAIYGEWPGDGISGRLDTRFELIDYLIRIGARDEVVPELLRLKAELPQGQVAAARRAADLLAAHGATELAAETLRTTSLSAPSDVELLAHLAALQVSAGDPNAARATLRRAVALAPGRPDLGQRLRVVDRVLALDPSLPGLGLVARTRRARLLLSGVLEQTACHAETEEWTALTKGARASLRRSARRDAEAAEQHLDFAARIWNLASACDPTSAEAQALAQVIQRMPASAAEPGT